MQRKRILQLLFLAFLVVGTVFILTRHKSLRLLSSEGDIFGTTYHISYEYSEPLDSAILARLKEVDASLSMFNEQSTVSHINSGASDLTDPLFRHVYGIAERVARETSGAYDVTVAPLVNLWGFGFKERENVTDAKVDSILQFVGYEKVKLTGDRLTKSDPRVQLDFSSVAKGYGVDRVATLFDSLGIKNYMVEIGGEVIVKGLHPDGGSGRPWKIGIPKPQTDGEELQTTLTVTNVAMATSGNYRRFYEQNGRRYAHTIDPHTGRPVQHELLSATVFAPDCATADAYATAFMVLGLDKAKALLARHKELMAYFIYSTADGKLATWMSPEVEKYIK